MLKFSKTHEWVKVDGAVAIVGISDYAQHELGDVVYVELPRNGDEIKQNDKFATIESTKAASEVFAPLSGEVVAVNAQLVADPQAVNTSPYEQGWLIKLKISDVNELSNLMDEAAYQEFIAKI